MTFNIQHILGLSILEIALLIVLFMIVHDIIMYVITYIEYRIAINKLNGTMKKFEELINKNNKKL